MILKNVSYVARLDLQNLSDQTRLASFLSLHHFPRSFNGSISSLSLVHTIAFSKQNHSSLSRSLINRYAFHTYSSLFCFYFFYHLLGISSLFNYPALYLFCYPRDSVQFFIHIPFLIISFVAFDSWFHYHFPPFHSFAVQYIIFVNLAFLFLNISLSCSMHCRLFHESRVWISRSVDSSSSRNDWTKGTTIKKELFTSDVEQ